MDIVTKIVLRMYGVSSPTRRIMEKEGLFTKIQENTKHRCRGRDSSWQLSLQATPEGGRLIPYDAEGPVHGEFSMESGFEPGTLLPGGFSVELSLDPANLDSPSRDCHQHFGASVSCTKDCKSEL
ncbi:hypothetical protein AVEN_142815-1 [Araneus ventricosus]|uniref:Uncharacterized protein n=1 Tax=Araneus ventricosus TaxID=182803 RepID=A0A4Y2RHK2_ARAVE|nr:hypothetical protein AVEN_142815-1 [Araneus ventricosus]